MSNSPKALRKGRAHLAHFVELYTGYPIDDPAFAYATHLPCDRCGTVTATVTIIEDDPREDRVCAACWPG